MAYELPALLDLTDTQAILVRRYKRVILEALTLKEKLYCNICAEQGRPEGVKASVTDGQISIRCRCTHRIYNKTTP